eukprot:6195130-Prymnesium_polylepis.1
MGPAGVRGFMFWDIADEGDLVDGSPLFLAQGLNSFLKVRPPAPAAEASGEAELPAGWAAAARGNAGLLQAPALG